MARKQIKAWVSKESHEALARLVIQAGYTYADKPAWGKFLEALADGQLHIIPRKISKTP